MNKFYTIICIVALLCGFFAPELKAKITQLKTTIAQEQTDNSSEEGEDSAPEEDIESEFA